MRRKRALLFFCVSVLAVAAILYLRRADYWRPYNDTPQESVVSMHAHGFAVANFAGVWPNPVLARDVDVEHGKITEYNHWPNAFFLTLAAAIKLFGNTEMVGRSLALLYTIPGLYLLAFAFRNKSGVSYLAVPVLLVSPIGRDCLSFVFIDAALLFWIGFLAAAVSLTRDRPATATRLFRLGSLVAPFFIHLIAPFAFFGALARFWWGHRDRNVLCRDLLCVVGAFCTVMFFLSWTSSGLAAGARELLAQYLHRANLSQRYSENIGLFSLLITLAKHFYVNLGYFALVLPLAFVNLARRRSLQAYLLPAVLVYTLLLRNYIGLHVFANLPLVSISTFTLVAGAEQVWPDERLWPRVALGAVLVASLFPTRLFSYYCVDQHVNAQVRALRLLEPEILKSPCNSFTIVGGDNYRVPQMFCGERVVRGIVNGEPKRHGVIDLGRRTVTAVP
ncbi:hypothetical protein KOM00_06865 [Geomonas sp. Red69]|uniref:hypothetical protein n=1 Tax=Geomonas diazotrophica TaxID=2843197 RepID=UPI001C125BDB|nr:hypothetical protein [Geomonas diazotrophica]MBU5636454.1 hypothetical protein [Geomonas diazotrophica]